MSNAYDIAAMDGLPNPIVPLHHDRAKMCICKKGYPPENSDRSVLAIRYISDKIGWRVERAGGEVLNRNDHISWCCDTTIYFPRKVKKRELDEL